MIKEYIIKIDEDQSKKDIHGGYPLIEPPLELILCKDCKYLIDHYGFMDDGYCEKMREDYNVKFKPKKDWFCADGKMKSAE